MKAPHGKRAMSAAEPPFGSGKPATLPVLLMLLIVLLPGALQAAVDYRLQVRLEPQQHHLEATAHLTFPAAPDGPVILRLAPQSHLLAVRQGETNLAHHFADGRLRVDPVDSSPLVIRYRAQFNDPVPVQPVHSEDPSFGVAAVIGENGSYLSAGAAWYPQLSATAEINYLIEIETPPGVEAITTGRRSLRQQDSDRTLSRWEIDYPVRGLTLAAGPYEIFTDDTGVVPVYGYFYAASADLAQIYLEQARQYLSLYEELFGPYPFAHFAIVENFFPTGYGLPGWTLLGSTVIRLPFIVSTSLGHEIAHSWWGNGVWVDYAQGNWSEGLTTYVADHLYQKQLSPAAARTYRLNQLISYASLVNPSNSFAVEKFLSRSDRPGQAIGYGKTMMIFHMLHQRVGADVFWQTLRQIAADRMFRAIGWEELRIAFSRAANEDLAPFFRQWLSRTDGPLLDLGEVTTTPHAAGWLTQGTLRQGTRPYQLEVVVRVSDGEQQQDMRVALDSATQDFTIATAWRPGRLIVDPDSDLFRQLVPAEIPSTVASIRGSNRLLAVLADDFVPSSAAQQMLLGALRKQGIEVLPLAAATPTQLAGADLVIFGRTGSLAPQTLADNLPDAVFRDPQATPGSSAQSAFVVERNPFNHARHAAWFLADGNAADVTVARKVAHYGKYGYLLFAGEENHVKGVVLPQASPLVRSLDNSSPP
ncbi:MAG: M1 family aminopeptidase [Pelovirga sp.]